MSAIAHHMTEIHDIAADVDADRVAWYHGVDRVAEQLVAAGYPDRERAAHVADELLEQAVNMLPRIA